MLLLTCAALLLTMFTRTRFLAGLLLTNACGQASTRTMATLEVPESPRPSSRARTNSVLSVSSELTDPEELDVNKTRSRAGSSSSGLSDVDDPDETEDDDEDDDIVEVNADGSAKCATRIRDLLNNPPKEPKHRWETAVRYTRRSLYIASLAESPSYPLS